MKAKYRSLCVRCRFPILPGEEIDYAKGVGSAHALCLSGEVEIIYGDHAPGTLVCLRDNMWYIVIGGFEPGMSKARKASPEEIEGLTKPPS